MSTVPPTFTGDPNIADSGTALPAPSQPEYVWELATMYPVQGEWTEEEYLNLTDHSNRRIEFCEGRLEFLEMPDEVHESMVHFLLFALRDFLKPKNLGKLYSNGIRLRIRPNQIRLPDVIFLHNDNFHARHNRVWEGADIAMEVVSTSPKDRKRDYEEKLADYSERGVAEYWIVDYEKKVVLVHKLEGGAYVVHGEYKPEQQAKSVLLEGFEVDVADLFAAADEVPE